MHRLLVTLVGCLVIALGAHCTGAQLQNAEVKAGDVASAIAPGLATGCQLAGDVVGVVDPPIAGAFDLICEDAAKADAAAAVLLRKGVTTHASPTVTLDGGTAYRVRVFCLPPPPMLPADAGPDGWPPLRSDPPPIDGGRDAR